MGQKLSKEAGILPASLLMGFIALLSGCGVQVTSSNAANGNTLSCPDFVTNVFPVLKTPIGAKTCSDVGCHLIGGSTGGGFKVDPAAVVSTQAMENNYTAAFGFSDLNSPTNSRLLLKPLGASSVGGHGGGVIFTSGDPQYLAMLTWISNRIQGPSPCP